VQVAKFVCKKTQAFIQRLFARVSDDTIAFACERIVGELRPSSLAICPTVLGLRERESVRPRGPVLVKSDGSTAGLLFELLKNRGSIRVALAVRPCWTN
jgi:hypothetical protein